MIHIEPVLYSIEYPNETISRKKITDDRIIGWTLNHEFAILKDTNLDGYHLAVRVVDLYRDVTRLKLFQETDKTHPSIITSRQMHQCVRNGLTTHQLTHVNNTLNLSSYALTWYQPT